jgi:hypothetical protein
MAGATLRRWVRAALFGSSAVVLFAGCEPGQFGLSARNAEWQRLGEFAVVSASPERAVVSARGQPVAVEPPPGFCLAEESIETSDRSAVVLIGDCVLEGGAGVMPGADGALNLPMAMPGIITVSISGDPGFAARGASASDLSELEGYLATPEGRALLGRGGDGSEVSVVETRRDGRILYVLVEDRAAQPVPLLAPRFWRAFIELNDRLAVVTVSGFRDVPMDEAEMLRHLGDQVRQLQVANAAPLEDAPVQYAEAPREPRSAEPGPGDETAGTDAVEPTTPAEPGSMAASTQVAEASGDRGPAPAEAGSRDPMEPESVRGEAWQTLAADSDDEAGATGGPEPIPGWAELTEDTAATDDWPTEPTPRPLVIGSNAGGTPGTWPVPSERPPSAGGMANPPPAASAPSRADVPLPLVPSSRPGEPASTTPFPPRRPS